MSQTQLAENIAAARRKRRMTQEELARVLGVSTSTVGRWESGARAPGLLAGVALARALGTTVERLTRGAV